MGLRSQLGVAAENSYGDPATVDRFFEFNSETLERRNRTIQSDGIRAGGRGLRRGKRRVLVGRDGGGNAVMEVTPDQFGIWFEHALGDVATSQPDDAGSPDVFEHEFTFGSLRGKSLTIQKGVERDDETVEPFTFVGCKVASLQLGVSVDNFATATVEVDARDVLVDEPLQSASFVEGGVFHFAQSVLNLGGGPVAQVTNLELTITNAMNVERYFLGSGGLKGEPTDNGYPGITGQLTANFVDRETLYDVYAADEPIELDTGFIGAAIDETFDEELRIVIPEIRLGGDTPKVSGVEVPQLTVPFTAFFDGSEPDINVLLRNTDATP